MKAIKNTLLTVLIFVLGLFFQTLQAQTENEVSVENPFKTKEDYYEHQPQVEKALKKWFEYNPLEKDDTTLKLKIILETYLVAWINGAPQVKIIFDGKIEGKIMRDKRFDYSKDMLLALLFSKTTYLLKNEGAKSDDFEANLVAVKGMLMIYKKIRSQTKKRKAKTDMMEYYLELEQKGKLEEGLEELLK